MLNGDAIEKHKQSIATVNYSSLLLFWFDLTWCGRYSSRIYLGKSIIEGTAGKYFKCQQIMSEHMTV